MEQTATRHMTNMSVMYFYLPLVKEIELILTLRLPQGRHSL